MDWQTKLPALLGKPLFTINGTVTTVGSALAVVGILIATYLVTRTLRRFAAYHYKRHGIDDTISLHTTGILLQMGSWFVGIELTLHLLGIQLATLFASAGALALGLGFALKSVLENWLAGIFLRVGQTIKPGDVIVIHDRWLQVKKIGVRTTDALTYNDEEVMIPNSVLTQSIVTSLTRHSRQFRIEKTIEVDLNADLDLVRSILEATLSGVTWASTRGSPSVLLTDFGSSMANYKITVWIDDVGQAGSLGSELNETIWRDLKNAGIAMALPQLDVHLTSPQGGTPKN